MKTKFKKGDKVFATEDRVDEGYFTAGKVYIVDDVDEDGCLLIVDDDGDDTTWWEEDEFDFVNPPDEGSLNETQSLVGQVVTHNRKKYSIDDWCRITNATITKDTPKTILDIVAKHGFCFCVTSGEVVIPSSKVKKVENRIILNPEYTALISKDVINVGCQAIPYEKVLAIVETHKTLFGN